MYSKVILHDRKRCTSRVVACLWGGKLPLSCLGCTSSPWAGQRTGLGKTHTCENITFRRTTYASGKNKKTLNCIDIFAQIGNVRMT